MKLSAAVILYNPDNEVKENILSYSRLLQTVYLIDNSTKPIEWINEIVTQSNIEYLSMHGNKGIAAALNIGAHQAIEDGYKFLITMDQDSKITAEVFGKYTDKAEEIFRENNKVAVIGINYDGYNKKKHHSDIEVADEIITSGMIIRLDVMKKIGFFMEELFIDYVDYEYCYRLRELDYICIMINKYKLQHQIGGMNPIVKYGIHFRNHNEYNSIRQYYMARNVIFILKRYPLKGAKWIKNLLKAPIKILLVDKDKKRKYLSYLQGIYDGIRDHYGPIDLR